jgi:phospholipase C
MPKPPLPDSLPATAAPRSLMRRQLLRASVAASAASLLGSCMNGSEDSAAPPLIGAPPPSYMPGITNIVVVMMENRSFDNMLGYLYGDDLAKLPANWPAQVGLPYPLPSGKSFEGLWQFKGGAAQCTGTQGCNAEPGGKVFVHPHDFAPDSTSAANWSHPNPNPGEGLVETSEQLDSGSMSGFLPNYAAQAAEPGNENLVPSTIMGSYTPAQVKVLSTLAYNFAVFDHWFSAVPSETYCNRSFFHASTSSGYVENGAKDTQQAKWANNTADTLFDRLTATTDPSTGKPVAWSVYASYQLPTVKDPTPLLSLIHI